MRRDLCLCTVYGLWSITFSACVYAENLANSFVNNFTAVYYFKKRPFFCSVVVISVAHGVSGKLTQKSICFEFISLALFLPEHFDFFTSFHSYKQVDKSHIFRTCQLSYCVIAYVYSQFALTQSYNKKAAHFQPDANLSHI